MTKLKMHTPDVTEANIARIAELFPNCVTEAEDEKGTVKRAIDFDQLRQELSGNVVEGPSERYRIDWPGKREALLAANAPIAKTLRPCREESVDFDSTKNLFIEGDNLDALKLLQETYLNKVKMIYIDPPYNRGKDFIYSDNFAQSIAEYLLDSEQTDEKGNRLVANTDSNGRFHSDWLSMMYSRLKLARNLLRDDGVLFVSIDDSELSNLQKMCDEIYGGENYVAIISVENNPKGRKNSKFISTSNDYCLIYAKEKASSYFLENIPKNISDMALDENGHYIHNSGKRVLVGENSFNKEVSDPMSEKHYSVYYNKKSSEIITKKESTINERDAALIESGYTRYISHRDGKFIENTYTKSKLLDLFNGEALDFKEDKIFEKNFSDLIRMKSMLVNREYDALIANEKRVFKIDVKTTSAGTLLKELFGVNDLIFEAPKNVGLIKLLVTLFKEGNEDLHPSEIKEDAFVILDFFAGSATTAHAVMQLNADDGGNRKFIMVQLPEECDEKSEAFKAGYKTIAEIGKERIRRAGKTIKEEVGLTNQNLDIGFRVLRVDTSNMKDVYYQPDALTQTALPGFVDNIKENRTDEDLLFQVLLDWGVDLTLPIASEKIKGMMVYFVDTNALAACFETGIDEAFIKELAKRKPLRAVFRDTGYGDDATKINVEQIFKVLSPATEVKSI